MMMMMMLQMTWWSRVLLEDVTFHTKPQSELDSLILVSPLQVQSIQLQLQLELQPLPKGRLVRLGDGAASECQCWVPQVPFPIV